MVLATKEHVRAATHVAAEECWVLVGRRRGRVWLARRRRYTIGEPARVVFDAAWALAREESRGDVIGFLHTHPTTPPRPSRRDLRTMRAWCGALGKPLLCLIAGRGGIAGYRFAGTRSRGKRVRIVEVFPDGDTVVAVE